MLLFTKNPDKLWLHVAGINPAVKSADVAEREGLQRGEGCILIHYCCHIALFNQLHVWFYPVRNVLPDHNEAIA